MPAIPDTVYARDGDVHVAYQVVGDGGPDLLFVPTATFPIDLLWDEPTVAGHLRRLASFSRLILTDLLGVGSSDAVPIHDSRRCSPGPTGSWPCSTPSGANRRRSSRCRSRRCPHAPGGEPSATACAHWCSGARSRASSAPRPAVRDAGVGVVDYVDSCEQPSEPGMTMNLAPSWAGDAGEAALDVTWRAARRRPGIFRGDVRPVSADRRRPSSRASRRRRWCCTGAATATCVANTRRISPSGSARAVGGVRRR